MRRKVRWDSVSAYDSGQSFAGGENGYAVSGAGSEGLRERSLRGSAGRASPAVDANCAHAFAAVFASGLLFQSPRSYGFLCLPLGL